MCNRPYNVKVTRPRRMSSLWWCAYMIDGCKLSTDAKYMRVRASAGASGWQECTHNRLTACWAEELSRTQWAYLNRSGAQGWQQPFQFSLRAQLTIKEISKPNCSLNRSYQLTNSLVKKSKIFCVSGYELMWNGANYIYMKRSEGLSLL